MDYRKVIYYEMVGLYIGSRGINLCDSSDIATLDFLIRRKRSVCREPGGPTACLLFSKCTSRRMNWLLVSLISASVMAITGISDKIVIQRYVKTPLTLILLMGVTQTIVGIISLSIVGIPNDPTLTTNISAISSGVLYGFSAIIMQRVLYTQEVSRTIPITQSAPIFAALLALLLLGENISLIQWGGIFIAVLGSALISLRIDGDIHSIFLHKSFYFLMFSAFLLGAGNVAGKLALEELPLLYTHGLRMLTLGLIFLSFAARSESWVDVKSLFSKRSPAILLVIINEWITAQVGLIALLWSLSLGPVSLVSAVVGTRSLFTVLYSMAITTIWRGVLGEDNSTNTVLTKLFSTALIVAGITAIAL